MANYNEKFLEAEEQANRLATQLQELKLRINAHDEAASSLNDAKSAIASLTGELSAISQKWTEMISALSKIDTSAILQAIEKSSVELNSFLRTRYERISRFMWIAFVLGSIEVLAIFVLMIIVLIRSS